LTGLALLYLAMSGKESSSAFPVLTLRFGRFCVSCGANFSKCPA
jgi:hypothetical protein